MPGVFCTREVTEGLDRGPQAVAGRLRDLLPDCSVFCLNQVHSDRIVWAEDTSSEDYPEADGILSRDPGNVLCIRTADCVPVLFWADDSPLIGAVHAGWRGLAQGIVEKAIGLMRKEGAASIHAAMGPSIGSCCYAVGPEVMEALKAGPARTLDGRPSVDLHQVVRLQAQNAGVPSDMILRVPFCTCCRKDAFFSYRREGEHTGRNISIIGGQSCSLPGLQAP
jgi:YfiH family protein